MASGSESYKYVNQSRSSATKTAASQRSPKINVSSYAATKTDAPF